MTSRKRSRPDSRRLDTRADLWSPRARALTGSAALAAVGAAGAGIVPATDSQRLLAMAGVLLLALLAGRLAPAEAEGRTVAVALTCLALGIAAPAALHLALAPGVTAARAMYDPVLQAVRDTGGSVLLLSGEASEGQILPRTYAEPLPPGRGRFVRRGEPPHLLQIAETDD